MSYMMDASAVLAALFDEPGRELVDAQLRGSQISVVNLSEVYATLLEGGMDFAEADDIIRPLPLRIRNFRDAHAWEVAKLRPLTKKFGLSLGDRACIAQAAMAELPILTADRRMAEAQDVVGVEIRLIR